MVVSVIVETRASRDSCGVIESSDEVQAANTRVRVRAPERTATARGGGLSVVTDSTVRIHSVSSAGLPGAHNDVPPMR